MSSKEFVLRVDEALVIGQSEFTKKEPIDTVL